MSSEIRLNLGCGREPISGWTNVDKFPADGVDKVVDLEGTPWPWRTCSVREIRADRLLNHLHNWEDAFLECARVLTPQGIATITVHHGLTPAAFLPYEMRFFDGNTFDMFLDNARQKTAVPFVTRPMSVKTLERSPPYFALIEKERLHESFAFSWHLAQRFGDRVYRWPLGR